MSERREFLFRVAPGDPRSLISLPVTSTRSPTTGRSIARLRSHERKVKVRGRRKLDLVKVVLRKRADAPSPYRFRTAQAAALFFLGFATHALLVLVFLIFVVVAAVAAAWDGGWRVFVRHEPPQ